MQLRECRVYRLDPSILSIHNRGTPAGPVEYPNPLLQGVFQPKTARLLVAQLIVQLRALDRDCGAPGNDLSRRKVHRVVRLAPWGPKQGHGSKDRTPGTEGNDYQRVNLQVP